VIALLLSPASLSSHRALCHTPLPPPALRRFARSFCSADSSLSPLPLCPPLLSYIPSLLSSPVLRAVLSFPLSFLVLSAAAFVRCEPDAARPMNRPPSAAPDRPPRRARGTHPSGPPFRHPAPPARPDDRRGPPPPSASRRFPLDLPLICSLSLSTKIGSHNLRPLPLVPLFWPPTNRGERNVFNFTNGSIRAGQKGVRTRSPSATRADRDSRFKTSDRYIGEVDFCG